MNAGMIGITIYLISALLAGITAGISAPAKKRHPGYWMTVSFLLPPLVLILLWLPKGHGYWIEPLDDDDKLD
jgi:hypothetical protein